MADNLLIKQSINGDTKKSATIMIDSDTYTKIAPFLVGTWSGFTLGGTVGDNSKPKPVKPNRVTLALVHGNPTTKQYESCKIAFPNVPTTSTPQDLRNAAGTDIFYPNYNATVALNIANAGSNVVVREDHAN